MKRFVSVVLTSSLVLASWGPGAASLSAQTITGRSSSVSLVPQLSVVPAGPGAVLGSPSVLPLLTPLISPSLTPSISPLAALTPVAAAPAAATPAAAIAAAAAAVPSAIAAVKPSAPNEAFGSAAAQDFAGRITGERLLNGDGLGGDAVSIDGAVPESTTHLSAASVEHDVKTSREPALHPAPPTTPEGQKRGAFFPLVLAGLSGLLWGGFEFARWGAHALQTAQSSGFTGSTVLTVAAVSAAVLTGAFVLNAVVDTVVFLAAVARGRNVTNADLQKFLRAEVLEGRLDGNAAALVKAYRPDNRYKDFTFAFASRGQIWVRPELAATPWLLRMVLLHELHHMRASAPRGPPRGKIFGLLSTVVSEVRARAAEFRGTGALKKIKVTGLQRALTLTQTSLRLSRPYDVLVVNPDSKELEDPKLYDGLSDGAARVTPLKDVDPRKALTGNERRYRAIVLGRATRALPEPNSADHKKLESVLQQLDSLHVLATRLIVRADAFKGTTSVGAWTDLVDRAQRLKENGSKRAVQAFEGEVRKLWRSIASQRLKGVGVTELMDGLYGNLRDRGFAFLSFGPDDPGVVSWEKLLRYWESADGGQFKITRVDLEDGGHLLILRKVEARVGLWLRPIQGGRIKDSVPNASFTEEGRATARKSLEDAGFGKQLELFEKMEVNVRHVFGADVGRQEIYVTVPRRNKTAIMKYVSANAEILDSQSNFETHLMDSAELQGVKPVWKAGVTGAAGSILWIDTGADSTHADFGGRLDVVDMVDEGTEDWIGHGTHVAGISISDNQGFLGMAPQAKGTMAKVFSRDQPGASDGEIMGSAAIALKKGVDVISLSLGSRGSSADNLAEFFSQLTKQKNAAGEHPIVTASAGNSGPFDRTLSQPAAGVEVIAVAAAAKSKEDGIAEIAFYSSVGPDIDRRYAVKRFRFKPDITGIGGDVTTSPGSSNVYKDGVYSAKSKDAQRSASDLEDGKHTGMSGTSMSNPSLGGIEVLLKVALRGAGALTPFISENLAFAVKAVLQRTSKDMGVPVWFQGGGFVDAWEAFKLIQASGTRMVGNGLRGMWARLTSKPAAPEGEAAWAWLERLKAVQDAEDRAFSAAELAKSEMQAHQEGESVDESSEEPADKSAAGNAVQAEVQKRFNAARDAELPALIAALKDDVWLVRMRAAAVLMNLKSPASAAALAEAGLNDSEPRVRQMAFLALAEIPTHAVDALLQKAAANESWDIGVYAAYALVRRGDRAAIARIVKETANADKRARFTSTWLLGQIGASATAAEAEALSARVRDRAERGNIRHLASAALSNLADAAPEAISDRVVTDLLDAAGPENLALTRTIQKIFPVAVRSKAFIARLRADPLKPIVTDFVVKNREAIGKPGALSELVQLLARAAGVPLDAPTTPMDGSGTGIAGVDEAMGPVDLFAVPPLNEGALDDATAKRFETSVKATLTASRGLWLSVPEHKLYALTIALEHRGWTVRRSLPYYPLSNSPAEPGGLTVELGDGTMSEDVPPGADLSLVRVRASAGVSEVRVMAALEHIAAAAKDKGPVLISLTMGAPTSRRTPLSMLIDRLVASGIGVVVGAGNAGPKAGTVAAPGDAALAVVVAAASREGLQFYSSRGTPETPRLSWTDLVDDLKPGEALAKAAVAAADAVLGTPAPAAPAPKILGTAAAAERTAAKLAVLSRALAEGMKAAGRPLPDGWFPYLASLVKRSATPMPAYQPHEVGAGLFDAADGALELLRTRLLDLEALTRDAKALADEARARVAPAAAPIAARPSLLRRAIRAVLGAFIAVSPAHAPAKALTDGIRPTPSISEDGVPGLPWWKDASATRSAVTVPLFALRPKKKDADPGIGKYSGLGRYYREELAPEGTDAVLLLPHFAALGESPYAPVSLYALNEDQIDWALVEESAADPRLSAPSQSVDYASLRARESAIAREAYARFLNSDGPRRAEFSAWSAKNENWLGEYAEFMALSALIGKPALDWTPPDQGAARADPKFAELVSIRRWSQWLAYGQFRDAVDEVHAAGGKLLFDIPMFRAKNGVDAWKRPELFADLRTRNPGIVNAWVHEDWKDLALWRWSELKKDGYAAALDPYRYWLAFGFDGARADALHFAYKFGNGQLASGDEPGDPYVAALGAVLSARSAFPLAEAFEGKDADARRHGFVTVGGDWKKVSSHDDPRTPDFIGRLFTARREPSSGAASKFVAYTLGDQWRDPVPVKDMKNGVSRWRYRIPLPSDADYAGRVRADARPQLRALKAIVDGDVWGAAESVRAAFGSAADAFVKRDGDSVQIWAASMDWFLEEWGRDTFISLPGLLLSTGRFNDAKSVLRRFAAFEKDGLIPNRIPDNGEPEYNTADAPMWYVQALKSYAEASNDWAFVDEMAPVVRRIVAGYEHGASYRRYGRWNTIKMDSDGLVVTPSQATWMDADPEGRDRPVTPRNGKTVEINALWYANLRFLAALEARAGHPETAAARNELAGKVKDSFNSKFWFVSEDNRRAWGGAGGALRDVIEGDPHGEAIRPNMLFAISRGGDLLSPERRRDVVLAATRDLLTRMGPRTLSPRDSGYRATYDTSKPPLEKDQAYHQGTVWPWLMGAYAEALAQVRRDMGWDDVRIAAETRALVTPLVTALVSRPEGSLSEVYDGGASDAGLANFSLDDPEGLAPLFKRAGPAQNPGGTRSQAWSVAEILRLLARE